MKKIRNSTKKKQALQEVRRWLKYRGHNLMRVNDNLYKMKYGRNVFNKSIAKRTFHAHLNGHNALNLRELRIGAAEYQVSKSFDDFNLYGKEKIAIFRHFNNPSNLQRIQENAI